MHRALLPKLEELGLTKKDSRVYLALLEMGSATADQAAKATGLNRSTTYVIIKKLMSDGLVSQFKDGKKTKFNAESPLNLERLVEQQHELIKGREHKAKSLIPDLMEIFTTTGERPIIRYFEGKEGLISVREELLKVKSKEYYAAASVDAMQKMFTNEELVEFSKRRAKKNIKVHLMYNYSGEKLPSYGNQKLLKIDEKKFPFTSDIYIYDNTVSFANTTDRIGGIIIESKAVAETMRSLFNLIWNQTKDK